jgi:hypothetical protein
MPPSEGITDTASASSGTLLRIGACDVEYVVIAQPQLRLQSLFKVAVKERTDQAEKKIDKFWT